jgi:hypothetical protein
VEPISLKIHRERTEHGDVVIYPAAKTRSGKKALRTAVTCTGKQGRLTIGLDAKKGQSIRSAVGNNVEFGLVSPSDATEDAQHHGRVREGLRKPSATSSRTTGR